MVSTRIAVNRFRQRARWHLPGRDGARDRIVLAEMDDLVVGVSDQPLLGEKRARRQMARRGSPVAECERLALDIGKFLHRTVRGGDQDRLVVGFALFDADTEGFDFRRFRLGEHVGERAEIPDLDPSEPHRLDHRRVIGGDDDLDGLLEHLLEILLERLCVLNDRRCVLVWKQRDTQLVGVCLVGGKCRGGERAEAGRSRCNKEITALKSCILSILIESPVRRLPPGSDVPSHRYDRA